MTNELDRRITAEANDKLRDILHSMSDLAILHAFEIAEKEKPKCLPVIVDVKHIQEAMNWVIETAKNLHD